MTEKIYKTKKNGMAVLMLDILLLLIGLAFIIIFAAAEEGSLELGVFFRFRFVFFIPALIIYRFPAGKNTRFDGL